MQAVEAMAQISQQRTSKAMARFTVVAQSAELNTESSRSSRDSTNYGVFAGGVS
jgi:hypothetical protein